MSLKAQTFSFQNRKLRGLFVASTCPWPCPRCEFSAFLTNKNKKAPRGLYIAFFYYYYVVAAVVHLHNIVRPTSGLECFCLDVIPTFESEKSTWNLSRFLMKSSAATQQGPQRGCSFSSITVFEIERPMWHFK